MKKQKGIFKRLIPFVANYKNIGEQYIVSAKVHLDESTPHLHIVFLPVVHNLDKKSGKQISKIACSEFWKGKDSYKKLQDSFYKYVTEKGFNLERGNSLYIKNNGIPLNQLMRSIIQRKFENGQIGERQFARVECTIKVIENSIIAKKKIEDITSEEIQCYFNTLKKYSNSYIKKIAQQFNQAYSYAMSKGYVKNNPMIDVFKPKSLKEDKVVRALEMEEQQLLTEYLINTKPENFYFKNAFLIQLYMGLRIGEVLALRNTDIDLKDNLLKVDKTLTTDKNGKIIMGKSTKTYAGTRTLPIPEFLKPFIIEQMQIAKNNRDEQFFITQNDNYADGRNANYALKKVLKENFGITDISTHSLRHSYGTRCVEAGMRAVALQRLMGHTDVSITLNTYTSVFNKYKESELQKVNEYYLNNSMFYNNKKILKKDDEYEKE